MKLPAGLSMDRVLAAAEEAMVSLDNPGFCMACGHEHDGCEPDMQRGRCESCGASRVYGAEQLVIMAM